MSIRQIEMLIEPFNIIESLIESSIFEIISLLEGQYDHIVSLTPPPILLLHSAISIIWVQLKENYCNQLVWLSTIHNGIDSIDMLYWIVGLSRNHLGHGSNGQCHWMHSPCRKAAVTFVAAHVSPNSDNPLKCIVDHRYLNFVWFVTGSHNPEFFIVCRNGHFSFCFDVLFFLLQLSINADIYFIQSLLHQTELEMNRCHVSRHSSVLTAFPWNR